MSFILKNSSWLLLVGIILNLQACQTSSYEVLDESYFERDGYLQYARAEKSNIPAEDLGTTGDEMLADSGESGTCNCSDVKVCPGKPLPKPFPGTHFAETIKRIGLEADQILFIDDSELNVQAAKLEGMQAVQFDLNHGGGPLEAILKHYLPEASI